MTTVGATTHDRKYVASVTGITATDAATRPDIAGAGLPAPPTARSRSSTPAPRPTTTPGAASPTTRRRSAPFPAGTDLSGQIVVCDRGGNGRVEKGENVAELGAEGMILANDAGQRHLAQR